MAGDPSPPGRRLNDIRFGIELVGGAARRVEWKDRLTHRVRRNALTPSEDVVFKWPMLVEGGRTCSQPDPSIGATALHHGLTAVRETRTTISTRAIPC